MFQGLSLLVAVSLASRHLVVKAAKRRPADRPPTEQTPIEQTPTIAPMDTPPAVATEVT